MIDILEKLNSLKEDFAATEKRKSFCCGTGVWRYRPPSPQAEWVVVGSKYAESVTDWKTYSSLSLGKLPPGQSLSREDLMIKTLKEKTTKTPWSTKYYPGAAE